MPVTVRGATDAATEAIAGALRVYADAHGSAEVQVYRYNPAAVRARIIDAGFQGKDRVDRYEAVWTHLEPLDAETLSELTMLLLLTPEECENSFANRDFELPPFAENYSKALAVVYKNGTPTP